MISFNGARERNPGKLGRQKRHWTSSWRFNGARERNPGKRRRTGSCCARSSRFNGARERNPGKPPPTVSSTRSQFPLQWGPGKESRETRSSRPPAVTPTGFNGARERNPGKRHLGHIAQPRYRASMGPGKGIPGNGAHDEHPAELVIASMGPGKGIPGNSSLASPVSMRDREHDCERARDGGTTSVVTRGVGSA
jgi:hypothetical protein